MYSTKQAGKQGKCANALYVKKRKILILLFLDFN